MAALAASLLGYSIGLHTDGGAPATPAKAVVPARSKGRTAIATLPAHSPPLVRPARSATRLPEKDTPIAQIYDELAARAQTGDAAAAMRLLTDLHRCYGRRNTLENFEAFVDEKSDVPPKALQDAQRRVLDRLDATDALCANVTAAQIDGRGEWLRDAALAGDPEAMACYAMSPNDFGPRVMSRAWIDWAERWSEEAPQFAAQAFDSGQADTIALFLDAYDGYAFDGQRMPSHPFGGLFAPDPESAYAYSLLYVGVVPATATSWAQKRADGLRNTLSAEQVARAQAFAAAEMPRFAAKAGARANFFPCIETLRVAYP